MSLSWSVWLMSSLWPGTATFLYGHRHPYHMGPSRARERPLCAPELPLGPPVAPEGQRPPPRLAGWGLFLSMGPCLSAGPAPRSLPGSQPRLGMHTASCSDPGPTQAVKKWWGGGTCSHREGTSGARRSTCKSHVLVSLGAPHLGVSYAVSRRCLRGPHPGAAPLEPACLCTLT